MRTVSKDMVNINGAKFKVDLFKKVPERVTCESLGALIGKNATYISNISKKNRVAEESLRTLCAAYGLKPGDYIVAEKPKAKETKDAKVRTVSEPDAYDLLQMIGELDRRVKYLESIAHAHM